jgi:hypothetical protein
MGLMQLVHSHYQILGLDDVCSAQHSMVGSPMLVCPQLPLGFFQRATEKAARCTTSTFALTQGLCFTFCTVLLRLKLEEHV